MMLIRCPPVTFPLPNAWVSCKMECLYSYLAASLRTRINAWTLKHEMLRTSVCIHCQKEEEVPLPLQVSSNFPGEELDSRRGWRPRSIFRWLIHCLHGEIFHLSKIDAVNVFGCLGRGATNAIDSAPVRGQELRGWARTSDAFLWV